MGGQRRALGQGDGLFITCNVLHLVLHLCFCAEGQARICCTCSFQMCLLVLSILHFFVDTLPVTTVKKRYYSYQCDSSCQSLSVGIFHGRASKCSSSALGRSVVRQYCFGQ